MILGLYLHSITSAIAECTTAIFKIIKLLLCEQSDSAEQKTTVDSRLIRAL